MLYFRAHEKPSQFRRKNETHATYVGAGIQGGEEEEDEARMLQEIEDGLAYSFITVVHHLTNLSRFFRSAERDAVLYMGQKEMRTTRQSAGVHVTEKLFTFFLRICTYRHKTQSLASTLIAGSASIAAKNVLHLRFVQTHTG